ncbi:hypothetical protein NQ317_001408, partial [Molorchus minor]
SVRFIFIVSPLHRKFAEALDLFSSSLPSIEKSPVEKQKFYSCRPHKFAAPGPGLVGLGVNPALLLRLRRNKAIQGAASGL